MATKVNSAVSFECSIIAFAVAKSVLESGIKVIAQHPDNPKEMISVSVPIKYRMQMKLNKPEKVTCHWSADGRFLVAENLGNAKNNKKTSSKEEQNAFEILQKANAK